MSSPSAPNPVRSDHSAILPGDSTVLQPTAFVQRPAAGEDPLVLLKVAQTQRQRGELQAAENTLVQAARNSAPHASSEALPIYVELISLLQHTAQHVKALNVVERGLHQFGEVPRLIWAQYECLGALGQAGKRLQRLNRLAALQPHDPLVLVELGMALMQTASAPAALKPLRAALTLGYTNQSLILALVALELHAGEISTAEARLRALLATAPDHLGALGQLLTIMLNRCDWRETEAIESHMLALIERGESDPTLLPWTLVGTNATAATLLRYNRAYNEISAERGAPIRQAAPSRRDESSRIRIGYLSSDFNAHATAMLMTRVFELHDRSRFECFAYSYGARVNDEYRVRLTKAFEHWRDVNDVSDEQAAAMIAHDRIDVLVELKGYTYGARLGISDCRPAPVQLHYLGFPGSVARDGIDYLVADATVVPPEHDAYYAEKLLRMPRCYQANDPLRARPKARPRAELGLPDDAIVLCNFNATYSNSH